MKYLVKDDYYDLKDEDKVLHSVYRLVDDEIPSGAILGDLAEMMFSEYHHDKWEELFQEDKVGCGTSEVYEFVDGKIVGENLISVVMKEGAYIE